MKAFLNNNDQDYDNDYNYDYDYDYSYDQDYDADTWDALTDGMYGDYPGGQPDYDAIGF